MMNWNDKIFLFESKEYQSARPRIPLVSDSSHLKWLDDYSKCFEVTPYSQNSG